MGPSGPVGDPGIMQRVGQKGEDGDQGGPGPPGFVGTDGRQGITGPKGVLGEKGNPVSIRYMVQRDRLSSPDGCVHSRMFS